MTAVHHRRPCAPGSSCQLARGEGLPVATIGKPSEPVVGEWVAAIGAPAGIPRRPGEFRDELLGLQLGELGATERHTLKTDSGVRVIDVRGAALRAGIRTHDLILAIIEFPVFSVAEFEVVLASLPFGRAPSLLVRRSGAFNDITVTSPPTARAPS